MRYLICSYDRPIHLTCRAQWLAGALQRKGHDATASAGIVATGAPTALVEELLSIAR